MKKIAIVLVNYNGYADTFRAITSLSESSANVDIIIVDNASSNDDFSRFIKDFPKIIVLLNHENLGFAGGNNIGVKYALEHMYNYIILLNNDTIVDRNMIEILANAADENTVTAPLMMLYDEPNIVWYGGGDINRKTGNAQHRYMGNVKPIKLQTVECSFISGCCMCIHHSVFKQIGLLDESYFLYCEDTEFCLRLNQSDIKMLFVPDAVLWHKVSSSTGGDSSYLSIYYMTRNRLKYIKNYPKEFSRFAYYFTVISRIIRMIQCIFKCSKNWKAFAHGLVDGIKGVEGKVDFEKRDI